MNNKKKCFVIMPFSDTKSCADQEWTVIFEHIIKPAVEESGLGYECDRYIFGIASIVKDILEELNRAPVVIADLTDNNANVLWELGVRHTLRRRTILISQNKEFIPSDLKDYPVIVYDQSKVGFDKFKKDIKDKLSDIEANPDKPDSPVADFLQLKNIDVLAFEKSANLGKLGALISEMSENISVLDDVVEMCQRNKQARQARKKERVRYSTDRFSNNCLALLLSTSYIMLPENWQSIIRNTNSMIIMVNNWLNMWTDDALQVEEKFEELLPKTKDAWIDFMKVISQLRINYANDNYIEPKVPVICLSKQEHEQYLKLIE